MTRALIAVLIIMLTTAFAACNLRIGDEEVLQANGPDIETPEGARQRIAQLNIPYAVDEFVERAKECDIVAVKLFLTAGMNPNVKNADGATALAAATEAGHTDIIKLLKDAGAEQ